jgi:hypothetical protein
VGLKEYEERNAELALPHEQAQTKPAYIYKLIKHIKQRNQQCYSKSFTIVKGYHLEVGTQLLSD